MIHEKTAHFAPPVFVKMLDKGTIVCYTCMQEVERKTGKIINKGKRTMLKINADKIIDMTKVNWVKSIIGNDEFSDSGTTEGERLDKLVADTQSKITNGDDLSGVKHLWDKFFSTAVRKAERKLELEGK